MKFRTETDQTVRVPTDYARMLFNMSTVTNSGDLRYWEPARVLKRFVMRFYKNKIIIII